MGSLRVRTARSKRGQPTGVTPIRPCQVPQPSHTTDLLCLLSWRSRLRVETPPVSQEQSPVDVMEFDKSFHIDLAVTRDFTDEQLESRRHVAGG